MNFLYQSAFAEALGWSLIDSLWQMGAIWFFYVAITGNGCRFSAQKRHSLALVGSAVGTFIFFISLGLNYFSVVNSNSFFSLAYFIEKQTGEIASGYALAQNIVPLISILYVPAVLFFAIRLMFQVGINKNIYRKNLVEADSNIAQFVTEMCKRSGIIRDVAVWISEKAESPLTIGFWKPVILLPVAVFSHLTCSQVEAVLTHELYHIRRNDYLINIFLTVAEVMMFFNPFARMMFGNVRKERENSCDDHVIASGYDAWEYSQALYVLGRYRNEKNNLAIAATGAGKEYLLQRIRRIMKRNNPSPSIFKPFLTFFLCLFVAGFATRHKQIETLPAAIKNEARQVVYYSVEKQIIVHHPEIDGGIKEVTSRQRIKSRPPARKPVEEQIVVPVEPELAPEVTDEEFQSLVTDFVAAPQVLEFTIIDPLEPAVPEIICESPQPYVQKSSFYFTEVDSAAGKKVVEL